MADAIALSRAARELITRRLAGEAVELTDETRRHYERLAVAGFTVSGTTRLTPEALERRREFLPVDGPLSAEAVAVFREYLADNRQVDDANRVAFRELAAAGLMMACHTFARGDESLYRLTEEGWARRFELTEISCAKESA
jgi:hypothetical protein